MKIYPQANFTQLQPDSGEIRCKKYAHDVVEQSFVNNGAEEDRTLLLGVNGITLARVP